jgi:hypothetical protein
VTVLDTPAGVLAVKSPRPGSSGIGWLDPLDVMRREAAFYLAAAPVGGAALPSVVAVAPDAGVLVFEGVEATHPLDQAAGLGLPDARRIAADLGRLHVALRAVLDAAGLPYFADSAQWRAVADCAAATPAFRAEVGARLDPGATSIVERLPGALDALGARAADGVASSLTVCSLDMRADNLIRCGDRLVFIDWQLAAVAPGPVALAMLVDELRRPGGGQPRARRPLRADRGPRSREAWTGFLVGCWCGPPSPFPS